MAKKVAAGLMMFKRLPEIAFFLAHPGGPYYVKKDEGAWGIPKGLVEENEAILLAAKREFQEETGIEPKGPFLSLEFIQYSKGKIVHAWAFEYVGSDNPFKESNQFSMEWPPKSGLTKSFPEIDKADFFSTNQANLKIHPAQQPFIERLLAQIS